LRGPEQLRTQAGRNLFIILYQEQLISSFCGGDEVLKECNTWMREAFPPSPVVSMMLLMHDVSIFVRQVEAALKRKPDPSEASEILEKGVMLDNMLTDLNIVFLTGEAHRSVAMRVYSPLNSEVSHTDPDQSLHPSLIVQQPEEFFSPDAPSDTPQPYDSPDAQGAAKPHDSVKCSPTTQKCGPRNIESPQSSQNTTEGPPAPPPDDLDPPEEIKKYLSVTRAVASNTLRATHIRLLTVMSRYLWHMHATRTKIPEDVNLIAMQEEWNTQVARFAAEICDDIPYGLGEVDHLGQPLKDPPGGVAFRAYLSLFPIETAIKAPQTSLKHRRLLARRLKHIGNTVGIGMAMHILPGHLDNVDGLYEPGDGLGEQQRPLLRMDAALNDHVSWALSQA
jgi:hypothetical protein